ncbi:MAG: alpha/beta hydrolase [Myxococcales bacterium]|nr:alpha/beta hydrolase [Myxococcales bacterium]
MNPGFFGDASRQLYGAYHPASGSSRGVVIVPPVGQEGLRAHRALRILADAWATAGWHVLRVDPFGTGDAGGSDHDVTLAGVVADTRTALKELAAVSGARQLIACGLRLGATAALLTATLDPAVRGLALWEPITDGPAWMAEIGLSRAGGAAQGFDYSPTFASELRALRVDASSPAGPLPKRAILVWNQEDSARTAATDALRGRIERLEVQTLPSPRAWAEENDFGAGPVPAAVIAALQAWRG